VERLASNSGDPSFDYPAALREASARAPHNAQVVLQIDAEAMAERLEEGLMALGVERAVGG